MAEVRPHKSVIPRAWGLLLVVVVVGLLLAVAVPANAYERRTVPGFFGVNGQWVLDNAVWNVEKQSPPNLAPRNEQLDAMSRAGIELVRSDLSWWDVEPEGTVLTGATTQRWGKYDRWVAALAERGERWLPVLHGTPPWARDVAAAASGCAGRSPPHSADHYAEFVRRAAARYGPGGSFWSDPSYIHLPEVPVQSWEIWNEPNLREFWCPAPDPRRYTDLYLKARDAIRGVDPSARVMVGGLAGGLTTGENFVREMLAYRPDVRDKIDIIGYHEYEPDVGEVLASIVRFRRFLDQNGMASVPIALTEVGWTTQADDGFFVPPMTETQRAANYYEFAQRIARTDCGIALVTPHSWWTYEHRWQEFDDSRAQGKGNAYFGIANHNATLKPSAERYATEIRRYLGTGPTPAPRKTLHYCGRAAPDLDGDGIVDESDDYPLDSGRTVNPQPEPVAPEDQLPADPPYAPRVPADFFGVGGGETRGLADIDEVAQVVAMSDAGIRVAHAHVLWAEIEPNGPDLGGRHTYRWDFLDPWVRRLAARGIRLMPTIRQAPTWTNPLNRADNYIAFLTAFASRYGRGGEFWADSPGLDSRLSISEFEIWYMANANWSWQAAPSGSEYAALYERARAALRQIDPIARAIIGTLNPHTNSNPLTPGNNVIAPAQFLRDMYTARPGLKNGNVDGVGIFGRSSTLEQVDGYVRTVREVVDGTGNSPAVPLLLLDVGWASGVSEADRQLNYLRLTDRYARSNCGISRITPYTWSAPDGDSAAPYRLARAEASLMPAGEIYRDQIALFRGWRSGAPRETVAICDPSRPLPDTDGDGIPDEQDNWPIDPGQS